MEATGRRIGRYVLHDEIASGGMATVHIGRLVGPAGFSRTVAIKRLHSEYAKDPDFVAMFLDEARLAARVAHPNVVPTLDVVATDGELFLVMEFVQGESLARVGKLARERPPLPIVSSIVTGVLQGLHAAHEAKSEQGEPLRLVHRDVSPQNVLVGIDGVPRVVDFGVAKAAGRMQTTRDGHIKGKACYMAPEQLDVERARNVDRRVDVFAASIVLWELLTKRRLFEGSTLMNVWVQVMQARVAPPSEHAPDVPPELDAIVLRGLEKKPEARFTTALEMAVALEKAVPPATTREVAEWVQSIAGDVVRKRADRIAEIESCSAITVALPAELEMPAKPPSVPIVVSELSQLSSIPVAASKAPPERPRLKVLPFVALGLVLAIGALLFVPSLHRRASAPAPAVASAPAAPSPEPPTATSPPPVPPETGVVASASAPQPPKRKPAAPPVKRNCTPPYTVDPMGVRVPKPECY